jgi:hypothetical protein
MSKDTRAYLDIQRGMMGNQKPNSPDPNVRWGKRAPIQFKANTANTSGSVSATMISSPMFKENVPIAFAVRFGDPNNPTAPLRPYVQAGTFAGPGFGNIAGVRFTFIRSIDAKTGPVIDTVDLAEGEAMPSCELLARQITIAVTVFATDPTADTFPWTIEITAAPVSSISCEDLTELRGWDNITIPPAANDVGGFQGFVQMLSSAVDDPPNTYLLLPENPRRTQFSLLNVGTIPIAIGFGPAVISVAPGIPLFPSWGTTPEGLIPYATLILPGNTDHSKEFARYESVLGGFTGPVYGVAQPGHDPVKGIISITEGTKPVL